jgi:hypothetical protein
MAFTHPDYYSDYRWCPSCRDYVHFLSALEESYCAQCGRKIRCFRSPHALEEVPQSPKDEPPTLAAPDRGLPHSA